MWGDLRDPFANRLSFARGNRVRAAETNDLRSSQSFRRLAERPAWKNMLKAERFERVEQHDIEVATHATMLKSVIEEQQLCPALTNRLLSRGNAVAILNVWHSWQRLSEFERFVVVLAIRGA